MASKFKLSYPWRIFMMLILVVWVSVANLIGYEYFNEEGHVDTDYSYLWLTLFISIVVSSIGYLVTRKLVQTISRLSLFAQKAERGERIYDYEAFPIDDLGEIANNIVRLYARLQMATAENERQNRLALQQEQDKIRLKKELTNNINHELKTPVASIQACLETLLTHPDLPEEKRREFIERCYANIERLRNLLNDVSLISRMDDGTTSINKEPINLRELIDETFSDYQLLAEERGFTIENKFDADFQMQGNWAMLQSAIRNLLDNALNYSGGNRIEISNVTISEQSATFTLFDNGNGVAKEHLPHLFERFYRVDKGRSRQAGGTGLGLSIVKNAILLHGGKIVATNLAGGGLSFTITLAKN